MFEEIRAIIADQLGKPVDSIKKESRFKDDLNADSLDLFQIVNELEEKYDIKIDEPEGLSTVSDAVAYVEKLVSGK